MSRYFKTAKQNITARGTKEINRVEFEELVTAAIEVDLAEPFENEEDYEKWLDGNYSNAVTEAKSEDGFDAGDYYLYIK